MFNTFKKIFIVHKLRKSKGPLEKLPIKLRVYISDNADIIAEALLIVNDAYTKANKLLKTKDAKMIINDIKSVIQEILNGEENS